MGQYTSELSTEQERAVLSLYVTNPFADIFAVYDTIPPEQFAALAASFSRSHQPFQQRLLMSIISGDLPLPKMEGIPTDPRQINPEQLTSIAAELTEIWSSPAERNRRFIEKWAQGYGHNSIKELGTVRFVCEQIPDLTGKIITGHPLAHPQVKSSRYLDWENILKRSEQNRDIQTSRYSDEIIRTLRELSEAYTEITSSLTLYAQNHDLNQRFLEHQLSTRKPRETEEKINQNYEQDCRKSMLDYSRYLLPPAMLTSLGCSLEVRALEEIITELLSSPLQEDQRVGQTIWDEVKKSVPVLMGEKCHAIRSNYIIQTREQFRTILPILFAFETKREFEKPNRVEFMDDYSLNDIFIAAAICWQYGQGSFSQYYQELKSEPSKVKTVIETAFSQRTEFDPLPRAMLMSNPLIETLIDYGADRDNHRHRRGAWLRQTLTTEHGFETPEVISQANLYSRYSQALNNADLTYRRIRNDEPDIAQLVVPFAFRCRRLISWSCGQQGYYVELRSRNQGHDSYREVAWEIADHLSKFAPETAQYLKVDTTTYPQELIRSARKWYDQTSKQR